MRFYHTTTEEAAAAILTSGFRDGSGSYGFDGTTLTGVFLATSPVDGNQGAAGDVVLVVDLDIGPDAAADYAIVEEGQPVWEYIFPAAFVNERASVSRAPLDSDELDELEFTVTELPDEEP